VNTIQQIRFIWKPIVFLLCLSPALFVLGDAFGITGQLSANPVEDILDRFGNWALRFIMITLAVTPLRRLSSWNWLPRFRRMLGLFTFFYAFMHFLTWFVLDRELRLEDVLEDLHNAWFHRYRPVNSTCDHVIYGNSPPHGPALANLAQAGVRGRTPRRLALLVASKERHYRATDLRSDTQRVTRSPVFLALET